MENRRSRRKPGMREETEREIISRQRTAGRREEAAGGSRESAGRSRNRSGSSRKPEAVPVRKENFVIQGTILAVAGIIVRLIGILYRVPMTNIIGDEGMGYYSTAFNVYNIMLILSSYSLPLAVSKMVAARLAKGQYRNMNRVLRAALVYATVVGGLACFITWNFSGFFATTLFNTPFCVYALRTLAPTIWIMAYLGVLRGYFQGHGTMIPTAISQILEQVVNAIISVVAASVLFKVGLDTAKVYGKMDMHRHLVRLAVRSVQEAVRLQPCYLCWYCFYSTVRRQNGGLPRIGAVVWIPTVRFRESSSLPLFRLS